ncbi:hypothetical protein KM043_008299 [Ampulex compressa]|nr:hypothetical protein KM043_008299 [Ampulex compressa]
MSHEEIEKGIISLIYLENFVTYDRAVIKPGRNLNVIIGPNGTGKSTIVCAIVLGLGGKPSIIGRSLHIEDYIKAGCEQAKIEIHLKNGSRKDDVITRIFTIEKKSMWLHNKKASNLKAVQELTKSFNIQIDNLCQFLPQDKVQDFSKMNAQELLENTERSVGDPILLEHHKALINYRIQQKELETQISNKKKLLESKSQVYEHLKEVVDKVKKRKLVMKKITALKQKKAWIMYDKRRRQLVELKKKRDTVAKEMKSLEMKLKPINNIINKIQNRIKEYQTTINEHDNKIYIKTSKIRNTTNEILECENDIKDSEVRCTRKIQAQKNRDQEINLTQQQKSRLDNDLVLLVEEIGSEETLGKQQHEILSHIERQRCVINKLVNQNSALKQREQSLTHEMNAKETELQSVNIESKRLQLLRERSIDTYKGVLWLRENQQIFSGKIHEPMLLIINVKEVAYAKYLEKIIAVRDLISFACENKHDMNILLENLRDKQNLLVNAVHADPMKKVSFQPTIALESIKQFGFQHYLISLFEAPLPVMKYLVARYNLKNIPVGSKTVESNMGRIPNSLRCYFSDNNIYTVSVSKYTGEKLIRMSLVRGNRMLSIVLDKSKLQNIQESQKELLRKKDETVTKITEIEQQLSEENKELEQFRIERNKLQQSTQQIQALKSRINAIQSKIQDLQNDHTSEEQIRECCSNEIKKIISKQLNLYKQYNTLLEERFECLISNEQSKLALKLQKQTLEMKENSSEELRTFLKLPPTIEEINNQLNVEQAKIFCMENNVDGENVLQQYDQLETEISNLNEFMEDKAKELNTLIQQTDVLREQWLQPLKQLVERINTNFGQHFSAMNCAGEVTLAHGENIMDFDQYGLKIMVKFRDSDHLQELTRHHQSGGERAVTTAIYMISLQKLSRVPFRCVDEINQGMDAINERRVFDLLVKMTGQPNSSQYFLLTPKLLPNLLYADTVTVHCVFNGPFMIDHTEFEMEKYCEHIRKTMEKESIDLL